MIAEPAQEEVVTQVFGDQESPFHYYNGGYHVLHLGETLGGRYLILRKLGWDEYSTNWFSKDMEMGRYVTVNIYKASEPYTEYANDLIETFKKLQKQPCERIIQLLDHFTVTGINGTHVCTVTDVVAECLNNYMIRLNFKPTCLGKSKTIVKQVLEGLHHLHTKNKMVHANIKPETIFFKASKEYLMGLLYSVYATIVEVSNVPPSFECNLPPRLKHLKSYFAVIDVKLLLQDEDFADFVKRKRPPITNALVLDLDPAKLQLAYNDWVAETGIDARPQLHQSQESPSRDAELDQTQSYITWISRFLQCTIVNQALGSEQGPMLTKPTTRYRSARPSSGSRYKSTHCDSSPSSGGGWDTHTDSSGHSWDTSSDSGRSMCTCDPEGTCAVTMKREEASNDIQAIITAMGDRVKQGHRGGIAVNATAAGTSETSRGNESLTVIMKRDPTFAQYEESRVNVVGIDVDGSKGDSGCSKSDEKSDSFKVEREGSSSNVCGCESRTETDRDRPALEGSSSFDSAGMGIFLAETLIDTWYKMHDEHLQNVVHQCHQVLEEIREGKDEEALCGGGNDRIPTDTSRDDKNQSLAKDREEKPKETDEAVEENIDDDFEGLENKTNASLKEDVTAADEKDSISDESEKEDVEKESQEKEYQEKTEGKIPEDTDTKSKEKQGRSKPKSDYLDDLKTSPEYSEEENVVTQEGANKSCGCSNCHADSSSASGEDASSYSTSTSTQDSYSEFFLKYCKHSSQCTEYSKHVQDEMDDNEVDIVIGDLANIRSEADEMICSQDVQRQYRAVELIYKTEFDSKIDIWSVGCLTFELVTGDFMFNPSESKYYTIDEHHLLKAIRLLGQIPPDLMDQERLIRNIKQMLERDRHIVDAMNARENLYRTFQQSYQFRSGDAKHLSRFIIPMMQLDPAQRATAQQCLESEWLRG